MVTKMAFGGGSLVSNILQKSGPFDEQRLEDSVQKITKKSAQLKGEIYELLRQNYVEFQSYVESTLSLEQKVQEVTAEYRRLSTRTKDELKGRILKSSDKRREIEAKLQETQKQIDFVQSLVAVHQNLESAQVGIQSEKYSIAADCLNQTATCLDEVGRTGCDAKVYRALKSELALVTSELGLKLLEEWNRFVSWSPRVFPENPTLATILSTELKIPARSSLSAEAFDEVVTSMNALTTTGVWTQRVKSFGQKLLEVMVKPLIVNSSLKASRSQEKGDLFLRLVEVAEMPPDGHVFEVYRSLTTVFSFVKETVPEAHQQTWMSILGEVICPEVADLIIKHCLAATIPKKPSELEKYGVISSRTAEFERNLTTIGIFAVDFHQLAEYTQDVNTHFAAQKCQNLLVKARAVLMKPIHDTVSVTNSDILDNLSRLQISASSFGTTDDEKLHLQSQSKGVDLNSLTFAFPPCVISKSVKEFVELLYETLNECCNSTMPSTAVQLFYSARSMVDLFSAVLMSHHRSTISEVPRIAAVQHNNCLYLAHHLITLGHQFHSRLPSPLGAETSTFIDQVPFVRQLGEECFLSEMRKRCNSLLECLKTFGGFDDVSSDDKCELVRKGIRQALLQITKLSEVYVEVLPTEIHHKAAGALLNALVTSIINGVLTLEDIAAEDASELHSIVALVLEKGSCVLKQGNEEGEIVSTYCSKWRKLNELATVLNARLHEIVELWDSGNGLLAQHFTLVELRGLVKALFQNTERRAAALRQITL